MPKVVRSVINLLLPFALVVGVIFSAVWLAQRESARQRVMAQGVALRQQENSRLGLPLDYPLELMPIYPGANVREAKRGQTVSDDGRPMDEWTLHAETDDKHFAVAEFYRPLLLERGMSQKMLASLPNGVAETYADATTEVQFTAEKLSTDVRTQIRITIARLR